MQIYASPLGFSFLTWFDLLSSMLVGATFSSHVDPLTLFLAFFKLKISIFSDEHFARMLRGYGTNWGIF